MYGPKIANGAKTFFSNYATETQLYMSGITPRTFGIIMGWPLDLRLGGHFVAKSEI